MRKMKLLHVLRPFLPYIALVGVFLFLDEHFNEQMFIATRTYGSSGSEACLVGSRTIGSLAHEHRVRKNR